jgi:hypothetical protein
LIKFDLLDVKSANKIVANFADGIGVEQYYDQISKPRITNYKSISYTVLFCQVSFFVLD